MSVILVMGTFQMSFVHNPSSRKFFVKFWDISVNPVECNWKVFSKLFHGDVSCSTSRFNVYIRNDCIIVLILCILKPPSQHGRTKMPRSKRGGRGLFQKDL